MSKSDESLFAIFKKSKAPKLRLSAKEKTLMQLKKAVWVYFWLLLFEGALRKWVLPSLATPLLLVRDPIALYLIYKAQDAGLYRMTSGVLAAMGITAVSIVMSLLLGHHSLFVALFGARIMMLHFPLIFVIPKIFDRDDVLKMGEVVLWVTIPMTIIMGMQFYSPQTAWINRGVGGDTEGAGFFGANGFFRPPGTFSFTNGLVAYYGLVAAYVFYFWLDENKYVHKFLLMGITGCLIAAIPLSISRTLLIEVVISTVFAVVVAVKNPRLAGKFALAGIAVGFLLLVLGKTSFFQTGTEAFNSRLTTANDAEGGAKGVVVDRFIGGLVGGLFENDKVPLFGYGLGMGTNAGTKLLTGEAKFLFNAEIEWGRVMGEMGVLLGLGILLIRIGTSLDMTMQSFNALSKKNVLPWMLLSFGFLNVWQGQWAQPTSQGFGVLAGGLILAALKTKPKKVLARR